MRARGSRRPSRFAADTLNGVPSIVIGVFVYGIVVLQMGQFSMLAGSIALGIMMIPIIARTTEELLRLVPPTLREGALALGATRATATFSVVLPAALPGIITGVILALARIAGETAPLLFTAFNNRFWNTNPLQPTASLTVQIFTYASSPYEDWHRQAWAGALVLVSIVLICSVARAHGDAPARADEHRQLSLSHRDDATTQEFFKRSLRLCVCGEQAMSGCSRDTDRAAHARAAVAAVAARDSWRGTAGGNPRRSSTPAPARSRW